MAFVYSNWYIVMAVLLVAIIALFVVLILMDKKDKKIIKTFVESSQAPSETDVKDENTVKENNIQKE